MVVRIVARNRSTQHLSPYLLLSPLEYHTVVKNYFNKQRVITSIPMFHGCQKLDFTHPGGIVSGSPEKALYGGATK